MGAKGAAAAGIIVVGTAVGALALSSKVKAGSKPGIVASVILEPESPVVGDDAVAVVTTVPATPNLVLKLLANGEEIGVFSPTDSTGMSTLIVRFNQSGPESLQAVQA